MKKGISEHCPEETITTEHVPDENEKQDHQRWRYITVNHLMGI